MSNAPKALCKRDLVPADLLSSGALSMLNTTVQEVVPNDLKLAETHLDFSEDVPNNVVTPNRQGCFCWFVFGFSKVFVIFGLFVLIPYCFEALEARRLPGGCRKSLTG